MLLHLICKPGLFVFLQKKAYIARKIRTKPMKRTIFLIALLSLFANFSVPVKAVAQTTKAPSYEALKADIEANIFRAGLNMDPYEYIPGPMTPAPGGYKPFYISHYGRHGSRSNWAGKEYSSIQKKYAKAAAAGLLTDEGLKAKEQIDKLIELHDGMDGRLTALGAQEHRQIAGRMYDDYKRVFRKGSKKVTARSSVVPRVLVSMAAFTGELLSKQKDLEISWDTGETIQPILSTDSSREVRDSTQKILARFRANYTPDTLAFQKRIFTDPEAAGKLIGNTKVMMKQTFDMAAGCAAFGLDDRLFRLFSLDDLCFYEQGIAINFYLRQCNSVEFGDERMKVVEPVIKDIIEKADAAISTGEYAADLRFGHDYQLLALGSYLGLEGIAERMDQESCRYWPGWRYSPFAGNIQLIFYRNSKGEVLVKPLLNERETRIIGLDGDDFPYYEWDDLKQLLLSR